MRLFLLVLIILCFMQISIVSATLGTILNPFKNMLGWNRANNHTKTNRFGVDDIDPVQHRPRVDKLTPSGNENLVGSKDAKLEKDAEGRPVSLPEDFNTAHPTETPNVSKDLADPTSNLTTATASSSGHSNSVTSTTDPSTSASSVLAPTTEADTLHMVDFKIPGGESPDKEILPDIAVFKPKEVAGDQKVSDRGVSTPEPGISQPELKITTFGTTTLEPEPTTTEPEPEETSPESATTTPEPPTSTPVPWTSAPEASSEPSEDPNTAPTADFADQTASSESESAPKPTTKESARESDRFVQTIHAHPRSFVVQDVNDLFQAED